MAPEKRECPIVAYTRHHRVEGTIILFKGERLTDKLNVADRLFEPVQNARVYPLDGGGLLHEAPYLALNKEHVTLLIPADGTSAADGAST